MGLWIILILILKKRQAIEHGFSTVNPIYFEYPTIEVAQRSGVALYLRMSQFNHYMQQRH